MNAAELSELDARVLRALGSNRSGGMYLTPVAIAAALQIDPELVRSILERLRARQLVEEDGSGRQRFARTQPGDQALQSTS